MTFFFPSPPRRPLLEFAEFHPLSATHGMCSTSSVKQNLTIAIASELGIVKDESLEFCIFEERRSTCAETSFSNFNIRLPDLAFLCPKNTQQNWFCCSKINLCTDRCIFVQINVRSIRGCNSDFWSVTPTLVCNSELLRPTSESLH